MANLVLLWTWHTTKFDERIALVERPKKDRDRSGSILESQFKFGDGGIEGLLPCSVSNLHRLPGCTFLS